MRRIGPKFTSLGLVLSLLGSVALIEGCGGSNAAPVIGQDAPKDRMEGLKRMKEASQKYDQTAPLNKRSRVPKG